MAWNLKSVRSGWLDVSSYLRPGWSGKLLVKRAGESVTYKMHNVVRSEAGPATAFDTITGMNPLAAEDPPVGYIGDPLLSPATTYAVRMSQYGATIIVPAGVALSGRVEFETKRPAPSTWPGVKI